MVERWITRARGEFLDQLAAALASRGRSRAEDARRVADAVQVCAFNSTYTASQGPAVPCSSSAREREDALLDALDVDPPGSWWSRAAAVGLVIREDGPLWDEDLVRTLTPPPICPKVLEVRTPADWLRLVEAWPEAASKATAEILARHTGLDGRWLVPRWTAVAEQWDAVHLSIGAWARSAGVVQPVGEGSAWTMCAGWDPDATFWLTAQPTVASEQVLPTLTPAEALDGLAG